MPTSLELSRGRFILITCILALLSVFPPIATDMYLSAMGHLAEALNTSEAATELSLSLFFLGLCVGQLIMGPLIDGYGRKGPLLAGTALFALTSVALLLTEDVAVFNSLRFLQAIGACVGMVVGRAVVGDLVSGRAAAKMMTVLVMLMTLGPIVSPFAGSLLLGAFGWRSIFVTMVIVGVVALMLAGAALPETLPPERRATRPFATSFTRMGQLLRRARFMVPALVAGFVQGAMFAFITGSAGVFLGAFGLSTTAYGLVFAFIAAALVVFGQINNWLLNYHSPRAILNAGLPLFAVAGGVLYAVSGSQDLWVLVAPLWLAIGMVGLLSANAMTLAMEGSPEGAGVGSALLGALQFGIAFSVSTGVALASAEGAAPMALGILIPGLAGLALWLAGRRRVTQPVSAPGE